MRLPLRRALRRIACLAVVLAGCAAPPPPGAETPAPHADWTVPTGPGAAFTPVTFAQLPGWEQDHPAQALPAFLAGCRAMATHPNLGGVGVAAQIGGTSAAWRGVCDRARALPPGDDVATKLFFESAMQPYGVSIDGASGGLFTGYYEPEVDGSRTPGGRYRTPIYRRPADLVAGQPYFTRADIDRGALARKRLELLWLADPVDAFFLEIQGAGRVRLPDGHVVRVSYDAQNGRAYVPIGRVLVDRGEMTLDQVSLQSIRVWLDAHPAHAVALMDQNPSYVFFREISGVAADQGPPGSLGAPLTPGRSLAVDRSFMPLGAPIWLDTRDALDGSPWRRLLVAQDLGGAIKGAVRADIFFGWGADAEARAGKMRQNGNEYVLLPKGV